MTEWDAFTDDLVAALRTVGDRVFLIVSARGDDLAYVQFAGGPDDITIEASGAHPGAVPDSSPTTAGSSRGAARPTGSRRSASPRPPPTSAPSPSAASPRSGSRTASSPPPTSPTVPGASPNPHRAA